MRRVGWFTGGHTSHDLEIYSDGKRLWSGLCNGFDVTDDVAEMAGRDVADSMLAGGRRRCWPW